MSREKFARLADSLDHARNVANLGPITRGNLRRAAAELRGLPNILAERDALAAEVARLRQGKPSAALPAVTSPSL